MILNPKPVLPNQPDLGEKSLHLARVRTGTLAVHRTSVCPISEAQEDRRRAKDASALAAAGSNGVRTLKGGVRVQPDMAKDSFFIRKTMNVGNTNAYHETDWDIGAFVSASDGTLLRILSVQTVWSDSTGRSNQIAGNEQATSQYQLLTQTQNDIVLASDKAVIASGRMIAFNDQNTQKLPSSVNQDFDMNPSTFRNGYLIAVEQLYLGGAATDTWEEDEYITLTLECVTEKMTPKSAMALSLSQQ